jgi:hypothetical protein
MLAEATGLAGIALRAEDAAEGLAVADEIVDAAGAVDVLVAAGVIADAVGRVGEGTRTFTDKS